MRVMVLVCLLALAAARPAPAQDGWAQVPGLLAGSLSGGGEILSLYWLPDSVDPSTATEAIGIVYTVIEGAAGNFAINVGYFRRGPDGFGLVAPLDGLYGTNPRDTAFGPDAIRVVTTMPNPGDARCCPTGSATWRVDRANLTVTREN